MSQKIDELKEELRVLKKELFGARADISFLKDENKEREIEFLIEKAITEEDSEALEIMKRIAGINVNRYQLNTEIKKSKAVFTLIKKAFSNSFFNDGENKNKVILVIEIPNKKKGGK